VLGILLRAQREGKLPSLQKTMEELRNKAGFHIAPELYSFVLKKGGEKYD